MEPITDFKGLVDRFYNLSRRPRVVVTCPDDEPTEAVVDRCLGDGVADIILVTAGKASERAAARAGRFAGHAELIEAEDVDDACRVSVRLVNEGRADVIMKGLVNTDNLLRAVLNKEQGLLPAGNVLSHVAVGEIPAYHKLLIFSDSAVIPQPNLDQFDAMVRYDSAMARRLGHENPRVALIHFTEKVNPKFPCTTAYVTLLERAAAGEYGPVRMAGPMDIKTACDPHSGELKGISNAVDGDADVAIFPDLEAANAFYKSNVLFGGAKMASIVNGATAPLVMPSRADSAESKFYSVALACVAGLEHDNR